MTLLVLPDAPVDPLKKQRINGSGLTLMNTHASGRPWIYSDEDAGPSILARTRDLAIAAFGHSSLTRESLGQMAQHASRVEHLDEIAHRLHGPVFFVAADASGGLRAQGSATGTRASFWTRLGDSTFISDEQHILRTLADPRINMQELTLRISDAELTHPFSEGILWERLHAVPPGSWLGVDEGQRVRLHRWWKAPNPDAPARELAPALQEGIRASILEALDPDTHLSCDLSGGVDSTTLAYLGRDLRPDLTTIFLQPTDAANEDQIWSQRAAHDLESQHQILHHTMIQAPPGEEIDWIRRLPEGPAEAARYLPVVDALEQHLSKAGRVLHLNGHGGDELFGAVSAMTWSLVRRHRATSLKQVLMHAQTNKQSPLKAFRQAFRVGSPQADLRHWASGDFTMPHDEHAAGSRWVPSPVLPTCATSYARQLLRNLLLEHGEHDNLALHPDRTSHQVQESVRFHGALVRRMNLMRTRDSTIEFLAPYLDERIVKTALRLDVRDRFSHSYVKPLLALGRPSHMPPDLFRRRDKGEYSAEIFSAFRAAQERIIKLFDGGSALEDYGLIDPGKFQRMASMYSPDGEIHDQVLRLERTELWLRSFLSEGHIL